jgi:DNA-directed RNA polymerase specialized sigma24 family protein
MVAPDLPMPTVAQLHDAASFLPERQRLAVFLVYVQGKTERAAAKAMGITQPSLRGLLRRAKMQIAQDIAASLLHGC